MVQCWVAVVLCAAAFSAEEALPWWRTAVFYQVYPRSFKDSDGDGTGDLKGINQCADHFKDIGLDAIWLSPIHKSPMADFGYDISNFTYIEPIFGTMQDFEDLMARLKKLDVKLVLDFVPNHTSDEHEWFQMSVNTSHPLHQDYRDFYVWRDAKGYTTEGKPTPPNNWLTIFGGSSWTWVKERNQFYLHQFLPKQPDLNYRNSKVVGNMTDIINFWLDKGIDGFRVDAPAYMFEEPNFLDEPVIPGTAGDTWFALNHTYTRNQPETLELLRYWATLIYQRSLLEKRNIAMFLEVYGPVEMVTKYYGTGNESLLIPFNFAVMKLGSLFTSAADFKNTIDEWMTSMPIDGVANWVVGNHDFKRLPDRYGPEMVDTINILTGVLPGVKGVYYGEEIGMKNLFISWNRTVDPWARRRGPDQYQEVSRDFLRTPMQWDDTLSAGFSTNATTWLPVNPNYWWLNVAAQRAAPVSHLKVFQAVSKARQDPVLQRGDLQVLVPDETTLVVIRSYNGSYYVMVANLGDIPATYTSQSLFYRQGLIIDMTVIVGSINSGYLPGVHFQKDAVDITLKPKAAILLRSFSLHLRASSLLLTFTTLMGICVKIP